MNSILWENPTKDEKSTITKTLKDEYGDLAFFSVVSLIIIGVVIVSIYGVLVYELPLEDYKGIILIFSVIVFINISLLVLNRNKRIFDYILHLFGFSSVCRSNLLDVNKDGILLSCSDERIKVLDSSNMLYLKSKINNSVLFIKIKGVNTYYII